MSDQQVTMNNQQVTCSETHALQTPVPVCYTSQLMAQQDVIVPD